MFEATGPSVLGVSVDGGSGGDVRGKARWGWMVVGLDVRRKVHLESGRSLRAIEGF